MARQKTSSTFDMRYLWALIPLILVGWILFYFIDIVSYVLIAWVLSMIGSPMVVFLRRFVGNNLAASITLGSIILVMVLLINIFIPPLSKQARKLADIDYTSLIANLEEPIGDWEKWMADKGFLASEEEKITHEQKPTNTFVHTELIDIDSLLSKAGSDTSRASNITLLIKIDGSSLVADEGSPTESSSKTFFEEARSNIYNLIN